MANDGWSNTGGSVSLSPHTGEPAEQGDGAKAPAANASTGPVDAQPAGLDSAEAPGSGKTLDVEHPLAGDQERPSLDAHGQPVVAAAPIVTASHFGWNGDQALSEDPLELAAGGPANTTVVTHQVSNIEAEVETMAAGPSGSPGARIQQSDQDSPADAPRNDALPLTAPAVPLAAPDPLPGPLAASNQPDSAREHLAAPTRRPADQTLAPNQLFDGSADCKNPILLSPRSTQGQAHPPEPSPLASAGPVVFELAWAAGAAADGDSSAGLPNDNPDASPPGPDPRPARASREANRPLAPARWTAPIENVSPTDIPAVAAKPAWDRTEPGAGSSPRSQAASVFPAAPNQPENQPETVTAPAPLAPPVASPPSNPAESDAPAAVAEWSGIDTLDTVISAPLTVRGPLRELRLEVRTTGPGPAELRSVTLEFRERAGAMELTARSGDHEVARSLQESLPELVARLTGRSDEGRALPGRSGENTSGEMPSQDRSSGRERDGASRGQDKRSSRDGQPDQQKAVPLENWRQAWRKSFASAA